MLSIFLSFIKLYFVLYVNTSLLVNCLLLEALLVALNMFISSSLLVFVFNIFSPFKISSFLSYSLNLLLNILPNGEYSNLVCSIVLGLRSKSSPVNNSYLSKLLEESADVLAASLSKSYCD